MAPRRKRPSFKLSPIRSKKLTNQVLLALVSNLVIIVSYTLVYLVKPKSEYTLETRDIVIGLVYMALSTLFIYSISPGFVSSLLVVLLFVVPSLLILTASIIISFTKGPLPPISS